MLKSMLVLLALLSHGNTQADDYAETSMLAHAASVDAGVIEEIIVIGRKNDGLPTLGGTLITDPVINVPRSFRWQFLPVYEPERANRDNKLFLHDRRIDRNEIVELFRLSFGH